VKICIVFISLIFAGVLHAASFYKEIENITGKNTYVANQKIIKTLFKNRKVFYTGGHLDYPRVLAILKENHLLNVKISRSTAITLSFATRQQHPVVFIRLVKSALNELGYSRIDVLKVIHDRSGFMYKVAVYAASAPDPIMIAESFGRKSAQIVKIKRFSVSNWRYFVDISRINLVPGELPYKQKVHLPKPLDPYWINVSHARVAVLNSSRANRWHPQIVFYDRYLNVIDNFSKDIKSYNVRLNVPEGAWYMKVSDLYTLENLGRGMTIYLARRK